MLYLYLDESGDLGFEQGCTRASSHFTVAVLALRGDVRDKALGNAVKVTLRRKIRSLRGEASGELKGSRTELPVKKYFYSKVAGIDFQIYAVTLDKRSAFRYLLEHKARTYNYLARVALDKINMEDSRVRVILTVDRSKSKAEIEDFNSYIIANVQARLSPRIPLEIYHRRSHEALQLQAADLFTWGIFRRHEREDSTWLDIFREKVAFDGMCLL